MTRHDQGTEASPDPWKAVARLSLNGEVTHSTYHVYMADAVDRVRAAVEAQHEQEMARVCAIARAEVAEGAAERLTLEVAYQQEIERLTQERDKWFRLYCILSEQMKEETQSLRAAEAERDALAAQIAGLREAEVTRLEQLAAWIRTPGNIWIEDAVDECARLLENNARALRAALAATEGGTDGD